MSTKTDLHENTSLTRCVSHRGRDSGVRYALEDGLDDDRTNLDSAISAIRSSLGDTHPDDSTLPLDSVRVSYQRNNVALGVGNYRRPVTTVDLSLAAKAQTSRRAGTVSITWWRDSTSFDSDGLPDGPILFEPYSDDTPDAELRPRPYSLTLGIQVIEMPTLLDDHPNTSFLSSVGTTNTGSDSQFLTTGGFPAGTLFFGGWTSRYVGSGKFLVVYRVIYMKEKWPLMIPPIYNTSTDEWETSIVDQYDRTSFGTLPVHTPLT